MEIQIIRKCLKCNKDFIPRIDHQIYCSRVCGKRARYKRQRKGHNGWYRDVIINTLGKECFKCHSIQRLHIHHKTPRYLGGRDIMDNLVLLCEKCHRGLHY